jgi:CRP/FNR family transcriptional regulator
VGGAARPARGGLRRGPQPAELPLGHVDVLRTIGDDDLARLELLLPRVAWLAGTPPPAGLVLDDHLYIVREGRLALLGTAATGHSIMIALLDRGAVLSTLGGAAPPEAIALADSVISPVPAQMLRALTARYPQLGLDIAEALSERVAMLREVTAVVGQMHVDDRLWARLVQLAEQMGVATTAGIDLRLGLTHAQWARLIGCSRESVTLALARLRRRGSIRITGRTITIPWEAAGESGARAGSARGGDRLQP